MGCRNSHAIVASEARKNEQNSLHGLLPAESSTRLRRIDLAGAQCKLASRRPSD